EERFLGAAGFAPTHAVAYGRMTGRPRLTVHADLLSQAPTHARPRIRELDALGPDPARPTNETPLRVDERHVVRRPRQILPGPLPSRSHPAGASSTAAAGVAAYATPLDPNHQATALCLVHCHDPKSRESENPRTIPSRSHRSSL